MGALLRKIGYGFIVWVIPYGTSLPLLLLMRSDLTFFKTITVVESSISS